MPEISYGKRRCIVLSPGRFLRNRKAYAMDETDVILDDLIQAVHDTREYSEYRQSVEDLKKVPDLYSRVADYKRRSVALQLSDGDNIMQQMQDLQNEFSDLGNNGAAGNFLTAEHRYCGMIKRIQKKFLEATGPDISFIEE